MNNGENCGVCSLLRDIPHKNFIYVDIMITHMVNTGPFTARICYGWWTAEYMKIIYG